MVYKSILKIIIISLILLTFVFACGTGTYTIKDENFAATDAADGEGVLEIRESSDGVKVTAQGDVKFQWHQAGPGFTPWAHGLVHVYVGEVNYAGYTFNSSADDPLHFVVHRDRGFYYKKGAGTVTTPDGDEINLP